MMSLGIDIQPGNCDAAFTVASRVNSKPSMVPQFWNLGVVVPIPSAHSLSIKLEPVAHVTVFSKSPM